MSEILIEFPGDADLLRDLKARIQTAQIKAALAVNSEMVLLYWSIGREISQKIRKRGGGQRELSGWPQTSNVNSLQ